MNNDKFTSLTQVNAAIVACEKCPRLRTYCEAVAHEKRRAFREETYWGKPLPGFGDASAHVLIVGLAPAAQGGNRTGRMFTGDRSGDFLYAALHRAGFANQPIATACDDGLQLIDAYITAAGRCAPPDNKPTPEELNHCRAYLIEELRLLQQVRVIVALGKIAFDNVLAALTDRGVAIPKPRPAFGHEAVYPLDRYTLIASYHPSQRNTQTGLLTPLMFDRVFTQARALAVDDAAQRRDV
jgi:uracil-DNA glycosylase family 4